MPGTVPVFYRLFYRWRNRGPERWSQRMSRGSQDSKLHLSNIKAHVLSYFRAADFRWSVIFSNSPANSLLHTHFPQGNLKEKFWPRHSSLAWWSWMKFCMSRGKRGCICRVNLPLAPFWLIRKVRLAAVLDKPSNIMASLSGSLLLIPIKPRKGIPLCGASLLQGDSQEHGFSPLRSSDIFKPCLLRYQCLFRIKPVERKTIWRIAPGKFSWARPGRTYHFHSYMPWPRTQFEVRKDSWAICPATRRNWFGGQLTSLWLTLQPSRKNTWPGGRMEV